MLEFYKSALKQGYELWLAGGWAMYPLGINAFILYTKAAQIRVELGRKAFRPMERIARKRHDPVEHASLAAQYLNARGIDVPPDASLDEMEHSFEELRATELPPLEELGQLVDTVAAGAQVDMNEAAEAVDESAALEQAVAYASDAVAENVSRTLN